MVRRPQVVRSIDGISRPAQRKSWTRRYKRWFKRSRLAQLVVAAVIVGGVVGGGVVLSKEFASPDYDDLSTVTSAVSRHVLLPDEAPVLATVTDKSALKTPFLKDSENGDRILIYRQAKKVIIYRPSVDRVVNIGPVDVDNIPTSTQ